MTWQVPVSVEICESPTRPRPSATLLHSTSLSLELVTIDKGHYGNMHACSVVAPWRPLTVVLPDPMRSRTRRNVKESRYQQNVLDRRENC
jgi:hypothetical protein